MRFPPPLQQVDLVAILQGAEAVRDEDDDFLVRQGVDSVHHSLFGQGVERAGAARPRGARRARRVLWRSPAVDR